LEDIINFINEPIINWVMDTIELSKDLVLPVRERVLELLEKPYAGSKAFKYNHSDARYVSNCHGSMAYIFGLEDRIIKERSHPIVILENQMKELIKGDFILSEDYKVGNLICFYEILDSEMKNLLHTALLTEYDLTESNCQIFQQSGYGGIFEVKTIETKLINLTAFGSDGVEVRNYRLRE
jgi:hypothetical protein